MEARLTQNWGFRFVLKVFALAPASYNHKGTLGFHFGLNRQRAGFGLHGLTEKQGCYNFYGQNISESNAFD